MALGGVYVGVSLAPSLLPVLQKGSFMQSLTAKGRFAELLQSIEVVVALNPHTTLLGAAHFALRL
jgi:glucokinase